LGNIWRYIMHIPHGYLAGWLLDKKPAVGIGWLSLIITYQYLESREINDISHLDMRGYLIGYILWSGKQYILDERKADVKKALEKLRVENRQNDGDHA